MNHWDVIIESARGDLSFSFSSRDEAFTVWNVLSNQWRNGSLLLGSESVNGRASLNAQQVKRITLMGVGAPNQNAVPQAA